MTASCIDLVQVCKDGMPRSWSHKVMMGLDSSNNVVVGKGQLWFQEVEGHSGYCRMIKVQRAWQQ